MAFGTFDLVIDGERLDGTPENKARLHLTAQGPGTLRDDDGDEFKFPAQFAKSDGVSISLPYELTLFTDSIDGNSTTIGYEGYVRTDYGRVTFQFAAPENGSTVQLVDLTDDVVTPISDLQVFRDEAEAARDEAVVAAAGIRGGPSASSANTQRFLTEVGRNQRDLNLLLVGDSTANEQAEWFYLAMSDFAVAHPEFTFSYHLWNDGTSDWSAATTIQTGTGANTIHLWNFSVSGQTVAYALGSRYPKLVATAADLVLISHGKNEGSVAANYTEPMWAGQMLALTEPLTADLPTASLCLVLQNPNRDDNDMAAKARAYENLAAVRGYGILDAHDVIVATGNVTGYTKADGIHPTTSSDAPAPNGSRLWADVMLAALTLDRQTGAARAQQPSTLTTYADQLLGNGDFSAFTGSVPDGFTLTAATSTKDNRAGWFETITGTGYAVRLQATGAAQSFMRYEWPATDLAKLKGRWVTAAVRVKVPAGQAVTAGRIGWTDGVQTAVNSGNYAAARDGFHWRVQSFRVSDSPSYLRLTLFADTAASAGADVTVDRVHVVIGRLPRLGTKGTKGDPGAAGDPSSTQVDYLSTVGANPVVAALALAGSSSAVIGNTNSGLVVPIKPHRNMTIAALEWVVGTVAAGNYDVAILDSTGARLWSKGSTAWPVANAFVTETVSPAVSLTAGQTYYVILVADNATATYKGLNTNADVLKVLNGTPHAKIVGSVFPVPSTVTIGTTATGKLPVVMLRETA